MTIPAVLFVDDDPNILRGLKRMLREKRNVWKMDFAESGAAALDMMSEKTFDVVVSDMRMPGMDGAELLENVQKKNPSAVRMILSGYSEEEAVLRTVGPAHRYLSKPCQTEALVDSIDSALLLRGYLDSPKLRTLVASMGTLPSSPDVYMDLMEELRSENTSTARVSQILSRDVAMTAETLKLTNSAFFSSPTHVADLDHAVRLLGLDTIRALTLIAGIFTQYKGASGPSAIIHRLSQRSLALGMIAKRIAESEGYKPSEVQEALCAGVLSHVGSLLLISKYPDHFDTAMKSVEKGHENICQAERGVFGASHPELGAYLLGLWGFVDTILEAVAYHHEPSNYGKLGNRNIGVIHCAQAFAKLNAKGANEGNVLETLDVDYLTMTGQIDQVPAWQELAMKVLDRGDV